MSEDQALIEGEPEPSRILVVDDEEIIREMLFAYLVEEGYVVDMAADGIEGVAKVRQNTYDVIITDVRLPGGSGMDILRAARASAPQTEVIVMTAFSTEDLAIEAVRLGAYDYLKKPVEDMGLFALLIRQILQKQHLARENTKLLEDLRSRNTELHSANTKLLSMATTDALTGIYNRRYILARLEQQFQQTQRYGDPFALLILDLDHFKAVNDTHGHQTGDEVLKHLVTTVARLIRTTDLFGRYGGEEFLLVLHAAELEDARRTADRLRETVARTPYVSGHVKIDLTMSIGLMAAPHAGMAAMEDLVRAADTALYRAKAEGRNRVVVADEVYEAAQVGAAK